jgi:uncharacterized membrane protein
MRDEETIQDQEMVEGAAVLDEENETAQVPSDEWTAAALAHASVILTLILGAAGGVGAVIGPAVVLAMYFGYRERSRFVAFHALQSFVYQVAGMLLYTVAASVLGSLVWVAWSVSGALAQVFVGLLMMPFALLLSLLTALILVIAPLVWLCYGLYAAYKVYQGHNFYYEWIGERVEREVKSDA